MLSFLFFSLFLILNLPIMKRNKEPLGVRLNNPFNIRFSRRNMWLGQIGNVNGFCKFILPFYGVRAFALLYRTYLFTGRNTISLFIRSYAPSAENNTDLYVKFVCNYMGCDPHYKLSLKDFHKFALAVCSYEIGSYSIQFVDQIEGFIF